MKIVSQFIFQHQTFVLTFETVLVFLKNFIKAIFVKMIPSLFLCPLAVDSESRGQLLGLSL